jgi:ferredoxin, 2Fe-2S
VALITYIEYDGTEHRVQVEVGSSVMQGALDNAIEGIVAECGGSCTCATCHCYVDAAWFHRLKPADELEQDMLVCAHEPQRYSRLSCQIEVSDELDGLIVHLPASQY